MLERGQKQVSHGDEVPDLEETARGGLRLLARTAYRVNAGVAAPDERATQPTEQALLFPPLWPR